jgi:TPR repeat protein
MDKAAVFMLAWLGLAAMPALAGDLAPRPAKAKAAAEPYVQRIDFVFDNRVTRTNSLPSEYLRRVRRAMIAGRALRNDDLRALADAGDGLAAFRYARAFEASGKPDPTGAAAHYYAISAYTGRDFAVTPLVRLLVAHGKDYSASRLRNGLNALTIQALSGNGTAAAALGKMYTDGVPFGRDLAEAQKFLAMSAAGADPKGALGLGIMLLSDPSGM